MDLIAYNLEEKIRREGPLARRMRPESLAEFVGQEDLLAPGKALRVIAEKGGHLSLLFHGPPGTGKTSLARIIAARAKAAFIQLNAVSSGVADVRKVIEKASENWSLHDRRTFLFIDEIHRFSRAQQDVLLAAMENGVVLFIGATTENPFFYLTGPLLSRLRLCRFNPLSKENIIELLDRALEDRGKGLGSLELTVLPEAREVLAREADGDVRAALNALEMAALLAINNGEKGSVVDPALAREALKGRIYSYDRQGDNHYDMASALIKSVRGSDPDAALYWMARMLQGGEDPRFIARRLVISAAEDIGNADPEALRLAVAASQAVELLGLPEGRIPLAQVAVYLAAAPKSNASYLAINEAVAFVEGEASEAVPPHLRDTSYRGAERMGHGRGYLYPHDYPGHYVVQDYLPPALKGQQFYRPTEEGREKDLARRMRLLRRETSVSDRGERGEKD